MQIGFVVQLKRFIIIDVVRHSIEKLYYRFC